MTDSPSGPRLLHGAPIAAEIRASVKEDVAAFRRKNGYAPTLAVVLVGKDAPSAVYLGQILRSCRNVGIEGRLVEMSGRVSAARIRRRIIELNEDPLVAGIIVQMPLPRRIPLTSVIESLDPAKDIDGIHPLNAGLMALGYEGFLPTTAQAAVEILKRSGIRIEGAQATVVGRSNVVGKPAALLLLREHATVTICHSRTRDLGDRTRAADIVVVAVGKPGLVTGDMLKPGAVVIDVGINVVGDRLVGDVDFDSARNVVSAITPVPGGVGPVTNALLMTHLVRAANEQAAAPPLPSGRGRRRHLGDTAHPSPRLARAGQGVPVPGPRVVTGSGPVGAFEPGESPGSTVAREPSNGTGPVGAFEPGESPGSTAPREPQEGRGSSAVLGPSAGLGSPAVREPSAGRGSSAARDPSAGLGPTPDPDRAAHGPTTDPDRSGPRLAGVAK